MIPEDPSIFFAVYSLVLAQDGATKFFCANLLSFDVTKLQTLHMRIIYMIVTLTTNYYGMDIHECPEYCAVRYCARIAQVPSKKTKYCDFRLVGQVLSSNG